MDSNTAHPNENNWSVSELVNLDRKETLLKKRNRTSYKRFVGSRYICVRERTDSQKGILVKVLGQTSKDRILLAGGEPFCKDDKVNYFIGKCYYSYPFPTMDDMEEVLAIIRPNKSLMERFEEESMHFDPYATFWVRETTEHLFLLKDLQYLDVCTGMLRRATNETTHYRMTIVYFNKNSLMW